MSITPPSHDLGPTVGLIECDYFCSRCGYNLHNQYVHRQPEFDITLARCPECGAVHTPEGATTSGRTWLRRLTSVGVIVWFLLVVALSLGFIGAQFGFSIGTLEELTRFQPVDDTRTQWERVIRMPRDAEVFIGGMRTGSFLSGFMLIGLLSVACYHWPRVSYFVIALLVPVAISTFAAWVWREKAAHLVEWGDRFLWVSFGCHLAGTLLAALVARRLARLMLRIVVPPRLRGPLSVLWTVDGLQPPRTSEAPVPAT